MDAATAGLIGAFGGATVGGIITWTVERQRLKHAERTHWHDERRVVYGNFLKAMHEQRDTLATYEVAVGEPDLRKRARAVAEATDAAKHTFPALQNVLSEVDLLASANVRDSAFQWRMAVDNFQPVDPNDEEGMDRYGRLRLQFLKAVHAELGIPEKP